MKRNYILIIPFLILLFFIIGCTSKKPDNVRQSIWDESIEFYQVIDNQMKNDKSVTEDEREQISKFADKYTDLTEAENEIILGVLNMTKHNLQYDIARIEGNDFSKEKALEWYSQEANKLKKILGI